MFNARRHKTFTLIAALFAMIPLGWASAFVLAQPAPARGNNAPVIEDRNDTPGHPGKPQPGPLVPKLQPDDKDPVVGPPVPQPKPEPKPPTADKPEFTGDATFDQTDPGHEKVVVILTGRVLDETGKPVPNARVTMYLYAMDFEVSTSSALEVDTRGCIPVEKAMVFPYVLGTSDADGEYRLRITYFAKPGAARTAALSADCDGYLPAYAEPIDLSSGRASHDLKLAISGSVTGRVVDQNGLPLEGMSVWAYGDNSFGSAITGRDGRFKLGSVVGDQVMIQAGGGMHRMARPEGLTEAVRARETREIGDIQLVEMASVKLELRFLSEADRDWAEAEMQLLNNEGELVYSFYVGAARDNGRFLSQILIEGVAEGSYRVRITAYTDKAWVGESWINVRAGQAHDLGAVNLEVTPDADSMPAAHPALRIRKR